jgi:hypothetical protein
VVNTYFWFFAKFSTRPIPDTFYSLHPTPYTLSPEQRILFLICPTLSPIIESLKFNIHYSRFDILYVILSLPAFGRAQRSNLLPNSQ